MVEQRTLTLEEGVELADQLVGGGQYDEAIGLLNVLLAASSNHPAIAHRLGMAIARKGDHGQAAQILLATARATRWTGPLHDLLWVLSRSNGFETSAQLIGEFHDVGADQPGILGYWGQALTVTGRPAEALPFLERAAELAPGDTTNWHNLSTALMRLGRGEAAVAAFGRKTTAWTGEAAGRALVEEYAAAAPEYDDNSLHQLFSARLWQFADRVVEASRYRRILDLGCGTGLLATHLPSRVERLVGIDLSPAMLAAAERRGRYARLLPGDVMTVIMDLSERFDAVLSSCVLYYIADLRPVFREVARLLDPGGAFVFTVDPSPDGQPVGVTNPGEYCHSRSHLRALAAEAGLSEVAIEIVEHRATPGFYCAFRKERSVGRKSEAHSAVC
jgi:predicted TPR repeat methyltransferase